MLKIGAPLRRLIADHDMPALCPSTYRRLGVAVLRDAISQPLVAEWQKAWHDYRARCLPIGQRAVNRFNPVVVNEPLSPELAAIHRHPELLDVMQQIYPDLGLFGSRVLVKDEQSRSPVFWHQDYGYDFGWPEKTSVFLPLSPMAPENGGLSFLPGTHAFGYLGDAGEIDVEEIASGWPVISPTLGPGDIVLMHECTWHASAPHTGGPDRVVVQIQYQPAADPSSIELLRGREPITPKLPEDMRHRIFRRSRSTRLKELQAELDRRQHRHSAASARTVV